MPRADSYPLTLAPTLALALTTDPNPNPNQVPNAESSLSVGFTSLRDGKALWLILTPKDGGTMQARTHAHTMHAPMHAPCTHHAHPMRHTMRHTMQARTEDARVCGGRAVGVRWACGGHAVCMNAPRTHHTPHTTPCTCTCHAHTTQVLTEDMELAGEVLQDLCTFLQISELESVAEFPAEMEARHACACAYHVHAMSMSIHVHTMSMSMSMCIPCPCPCPCALHAPRWAFACCHRHLTLLPP